MEQPGISQPHSARIGIIRPMVPPCSLTWLVTPQMLSSIIAGCTAGLRFIRTCNKGTHRSSARVFQNRPFSPARPKAVRTASITTTSFSAPVNLHLRYFFTFHRRGAKFAERVYFLFAVERTANEKKKNSLRSLRLCGEHFYFLSKTAAIPRPPPPQMHSRPYCAPRRFISCTRVTSTRTPVAAMGCPRDIPEPLTFTLP